MDAVTTMNLAETLWTIKPVITLMMTPMMTFGKKRMDVSNGDNPWTSWKLRSKSEHDDAGSEKYSATMSCHHESFVDGRKMLQEKAHKRLENNSIVCKTAHAKKTIKQIEVKAVFFQRRFGISAGFPSRS